jgi:hypothetical protein
MGQAIDGGATELAKAGRLQNVLVEMGPVDRWMRADHGHRVEAPPKPAPTPPPGGAAVIQPERPKPSPERKEVRIAVGCATALTVVLDPRSSRRETSRGFLTAPTVSTVRWWMWRGAPRGRRRPAARACPPCV